MYVLSVQYSCAVVSVFLFGGKANLVLLTLFYSTLLALAHRQTHRLMDGLTEKRIHLLRVGWRNLFSSCAVCCVSFWFWRKKGFGSNMHVLLRVQYSCGGALVFCLQWEIVFGVLHIILVYNTVVLLCQFFGCSGK
jgi:hypothetical protein